MYSALNALRYWNTRKHVKRSVNTVVLVASMILYLGVQIFGGYNMTNNYDCTKNAIWSVYTKYHILFRTYGTNINMDTQTYLIKPYIHVSMIG